MALKGIKVVEMMGLAPGPFCGAILADFGAKVTVIQRLEAPALDIMSNGKRLISVNLKSDKGVEIVKKLCNESDVLIDVFRPGVMEKLGLGPKSLLESNPRIIYARLTGYGQSGYYKNKGGHDINYVGMSGLLHMLRKNNEIPTPINFSADFAGGSVICAMGILLALYERTHSGLGQVIDTSMTEGSAYVASWFFRSLDPNIGLSLWDNEPGKNLLDGGAPFYQCYRTKDDKFMAVGALEPQFYSSFLKGLQLCEEDYPQGLNIESTKKKFTEVFLTKTQEEWVKIFDDLDACVTPVLDFQSVNKHECNISRKYFYVTEDDLLIPKPAPILSRTPGTTSAIHQPPQAGQHTIEVLKELGYSKAETNELLNSGTVYAALKSNF